MAEYIASLTIREKQPELPAIMPTKTDMLGTPQLAEVLLRRREIVFRTYENAVKREDKHIKFIDASKTFDEVCQLGNSVNSYIVDGCHPNDSGFACMAKVFEEAIRGMLI